ncbi:MAG TPA: magnesium/cobalt transporter CorA [Syntrophales bacterium]|nr:magnesium/cobalt transporter CorA [Syntrophales bacterium]
MKKWKRDKRKKGITGAEGRRFTKKVSGKIGLPPGSLVHTGDKREGGVRIRIVEYEGDRFQEREIRSLDECFPLESKPAVTWIDIDGIHDTEVVRRAGELLNLHPLLLEDIVTAGQHPKVEEHDDYLFIVLKRLEMKDGPEGIDNEISAEQISIVFGSNYVLTFSEHEDETFASVRDLLRSANGRFRRRGPDYLAYIILDAVVDRYFLVLDRLGERIERTEEELISTPSAETVNDIHLLKREMLFLRKSVWPLREMVSSLQRCGSELVDETTRAYLRDVHDHVIQVLDTTETFREMVYGMFDIYLSSLSNRMNEVMKILTMFASIFIPLTFLVGVYGMNFEFMPELKWKWSYPILWLFMIAMAVSMLVYFKRKKWF